MGKEPEGYRGSSPSAIKRRDFMTRANAVAIAVPLAFASVGGFAIWVLARAEAAAEPLIATVKADAGATKARVEALEQHMLQHEADSAQVHRELRDLVSEQRKDTRALYDSMRTGKRSKRLEDGGE